LAAVSALAGWLLHTIPNTNTIIAAAFIHTLTMFTVLAVQN